MLKIGITGGIGSGKSTVAQVFAVLDIPIYQSDGKAKWLMQHDPVLKASLMENFGNNAYQPNGELNRPYIAEQVFGNKEKLDMLNALVHPAVELDFETWCCHPERSRRVYILKEAALLFESGTNKGLDKIIAVYAPDELRIKRASERDGIGEEQVRSRMENQWPQEEVMRLSDVVIYNDGSQMLIPQVLAIHAQYCGQVSV